MSAISLNNYCTFGALYRPVASKRGLVTPSAVKHQTLMRTLRQLLRDITNLTLFRNVQFTLLCVGTMLMNLGVTIYYQHTPSRAFHLQITDYSLLPLINGILTAIGRILGAVIGNLSCTDRFLQYGASIVAGGVLKIVLGSVVTFQLIAVFGAAVGFFIG
jgi:hypothetical protein